MTQKHHWNISFCSTKKDEFNMLMTVKNETNILVIGTVYSHSVRIKDLSKRLQHYGGNIDKKIYIVIYIAT